MKKIGVAGLQREQIKKTIEATAPGSFEVFIHNDMEAAMKVKSGQLDYYIGACNTGAGAALSDFIYALVTGLGMSFVMDFIDNERNLFWMKLIGSIMLFIFGLYLFRTDPRKCLRPVSTKKGTLLHNFSTAFLVTLSNPLIIFLFIALYNMLTFVIPGNFLGQCVGYISIVGGAMLWWLGLTYVINRMKQNFGVRGILRLNRTIGTIVLIASVIYAVMTLFHLSIY